MPTTIVLTMQAQDRCKEQRQDKDSGDPGDAWNAGIAAASHAALRSALLATAFAGLALSSQVYAASFDCSKAQSFSEKAVCSTPQLSALDDTLGAAYAKAYAASLNKPAIAATRVDEWHWRQSHCRDTACVENWYTRRIAEVEADYAQSTQHRNVESSAQSDAAKHAASSDTRVSAADEATSSTPAEVISRKRSRQTIAAPNASSSHNPNNPPLPPDAPPSNVTAANNAPAENAAAISWSLPAESGQWKYPPLPPMSSHTPVEMRGIQPMGATASASSRTIGIFVGF